MSTATSYNSTESPANGNETLIYMFDSMEDIYIADFSLLITISIVGTAVNLWFLVAILRSEGLRSSLRNKMICNIFVLHLVHSAISMPLTGRMVYEFMTRTYQSCALISASTVIFSIQDFISNWLLVMLIIVHIAQIVGFSLENKLTLRSLRVGTWGILIIPWILSILTVPLIIYDHTKRSGRSEKCMYITEELGQALKPVDTLIPNCLMVILLVIAVFLKYTGKRCENSVDSMNTGLIEGNSVSDSIFVYLAAVVVAWFCDSLILILTMNAKFFYDLPVRTLYILWLVSAFLGDARVILMVFPWLILPDIRAGIKTWRPWKRQGPRLEHELTLRKDDC